jgi:hypothetical protein
MSVFYQEEATRIAIQLTDAISITLIATPNLPADTNDPTFRVVTLGYQGVLEDLEPKKDQTNEALRGYRELLSEWKQYISTLAGLPKAAAQSDYVDKCQELTLSDLFIQTQAKDRELGSAISNARALKRKGEAMLQQAAGGTPAVGAVAPPVTAPVTYQFKIPQLEIEQFDGDITKYYPFKEAFDTMINRAAGLTDAQRFTYLLTRLKGKPRDLLITYPQIDASYATAWTYLDGKYGKKDVIQLKLRSQIFAIKQCYNKQDVHEMFYRTDALIKQLENLDARNANSLDILFHLEKLLPSIYLERIIREKRTIATWDLNEFRQLLPKLLDEDDQLQMISAQAPARQQKPADRVPFFNNRYPKQEYQRNGTMNINTMIKKPAFQSRTGQTGQRPTQQSLMTQNQTLLPRCSFCQETAHRSQQCPLSPMERWATLQQNNRCGKCFTEGHWASACSTENCRRCQGPHHTFVCFKKANNNYNNYNQNYNQNNQNNYQKPGNGGRSFATGANQSPMKNNVRFQTPRKNDVQRNSKTMYPRSKSPMPGFGTGNNDHEEPAVVASSLITANAKCQEGDKCSAPK